MRLGLGAGAGDKTWVRVGAGIGARARVKGRRRADTWVTGLALEPCNRSPESRASD